MQYLLPAALVVGLLMYFLCTKNVKAAEIGRILIWCSVLALLVATAPLTVHLLHNG